MHMPLAIGMPLARRVIRISFEKFLNLLELEIC
jgi:hypothetical protein